MINNRISTIHKFASKGRVRFKKHALIRVIERNIEIIDIENALLNFKIIKSYLEDEPLESHLLFSFTRDKRPLHIVVALDLIEEYIWIITAYVPDPDEWNESFTKRKKS